MAATSTFEQWQEIAIFGVALGLAAIQKLWTGWRTSRTQTWPVTHGQIVSSEASKKDQNFILKVHYKYSIDSEPYSGEFKKKFDDMDQAELWADALRKKQIAVHYDPRKLRRSQLWESDLIPIVQSFPPRTLHETKPMPTWERLLMVAGMGIGIAGCALSTVQFLAELAGKTWIPHALATALTAGSMLMLFLAAYFARRGRRRAPPGWMAFASHAMLYLTILSFLLFPAGKTRERTARPIRAFSYQFLFYFGAFEACYLRVQSEHHELTFGAAPKLM